MMQLIDSLTAQRSPSRVGAFVQSLAENPKFVRLRSVRAAAQNP